MKLKKFTQYFILLFLILNFTSCTEDSNLIDQKLVNKEKFDIEKEFKIMYESKSNTSFLVALNLFGNKFKIENDISFKNDVALKQWLTNNIQTTEFEDFNEAKNEFENIIVLYSEVFKENKDFFEDIQNIGEGEKIFSYALNDYLYKNNKYVKLQNELNQNSNNRNACFECINTAVYCGRAADQNYAAAMTISATAFWSGNVPTAGAIALAAHITHSNAQGACANSFNNCYAANGCVT